MLLIFVSCGDGEDVLGACYVSPDPNTVCIEIYEPVCACNNIVYSNSCEAKKSWKFILEINKPLKWRGM